MEPGTSEPGNHAIPKCPYSGQIPARNMNEYRSRIQNSLSSRLSDGQFHQGWAIIFKKILFKEDWFCEDKL